MNDINAGALQDGEVIGQPCDPEQTPPRAGVACQATEEWRVTPPLIRNALKGDVMIVAACGEIGQLLRAVIPRQGYSHEGIMTRNYYGLSHSTADGGLILETVGDSISNQLSESALKYAWPGTLHASVNDAFNGGRYLAPNGSFRTLSGFNVNATQCDGDAELNPPVLIRPPIGSDGGIREQLHAAADIAADTESHYRFFAYSQANIAFDPPDNFSGSNYRAPDGERPTVSTSFIWYSLKAAGVNLEGGRALEQSDTRAGAAPPSGDGIVDGLYTYTEGERRAGARQIYSSTFNRVREKQDSVLGPLAPGLDLAMQQARRIASQFTNCFGSDQCGVEGAFSTDFEDPGTGVAVSPDDFRFWDGPETGGAFGDQEVVQYRSADYRRVHRWTVTAGTGTVAGSVAMATDGSPVQGAQVTVAGLDTGSDGFGQFSFEGVPEGQYEVRAEKQVLRSNPLQDCPADGSEPCDRLVDVKPISVVGDGSATNVDLVLEPEAAIPPPTLQVYSRRVEFTGSIIITDQDTTSSNDIRDFDVDGSFCEVSPLNREVRVKVPEQRTCADEVRGEIYAICELQEDNETVNVTIDVDLYEGSGCGTDDHDGHDHDGPIAVPACIGDCTPEHSVLFVRNTSEDDGDIVESYLSIKNQQGTLIENLPNVQPKNLRRVSFSGEVEILDDDTVDSDERGLFLFNQECLVDPFDREASFSYDQCVDDEVRLEIAVDCSLSEDNVSVNVDVEAKLYEGTTCLTDDRDGTQKRSFLANPHCSDGTCGPTPLQFRISNDNEGGDRADIDVQVINEQR